MPKNFVEEPFWAVFQKISGGEKVYGWEGVGSIKILCLAVPKKFAGEPFSVSLISGIEKDKS